MKRDIFATGLEALEIPADIIETPLTATECLLYQTMLLSHDRATGALHKTKVRQYADIIGRGVTETYKAIAGLNEKGFLQTTTRGWVRGTVRKRHINKKRKKKRDPKQQPLPETRSQSLSRALVHRAALKIMINTRLAALAQRLYWKLATEIDTQTGQLHEQDVHQLAETLGCSTKAIYQSVRRLNAAGLGKIEIDWGVRGHLPHVALSYGTIRMAVERKKAENEFGKSAAQKFVHYRNALYTAFGVPIEKLKESDIKKLINDLKDKLDEAVPPPLWSTDKKAQQNLSRAIDQGRAPDPDATTDWHAILANTR